MISRRLSALALSLLAFAGCHEDPTVLSVAVAPSVSAMLLSMAGGAASSTPGLDGTGGDGGNFTVRTNGLLSVGSAAFVPSAPSTPTPPTVFASTPASPVAGFSTSGSIHLAGVLTTAAVASVTIESLNGDIVVSGLLQSGDAGAAQTNITLQAGNGTVYVTGTVRTAGSDAASNGRAGGNLTINAARVVITGTIDTHGVANTTVAGGNGGKGGDVNVVSTQGPIYFTSGSINTRGGNATDTVATLNVAGGAGGFVHLNSATATNSVHVFAPITTDGGTVTGNGTTPQGGVGGAIVIRGLGVIDLLTTLSALGGAAHGTATDAVGGTGGSLTVDGAATLRMYGTFLHTGGAADAAVTGGTVTGGNAGSVLLGTNVTLDSVETGSGSFSLAGGTGQNSGGTGGGAGGDVSFVTVDGDITVGASLSVAGGSATGLGNASGGQGGEIRMLTDSIGAGNLSNHTLSVPSLEILLDASGGAALGTGTGGNSGFVLLQSGGDLLCGARINATGGASVNGAGGSSRAITPAIATVDPTTAVAIRIAAVNQLPTGTLTVTGTIDAKGAAASTAGAGGNGAAITFQIANAAGPGSLVSTAALSTAGANSPNAAGGNSGNVFITGALGGMQLAGTLTTSGSSSPTAPKAAGNITVTFGGGLSSSAVISAVGGAATDPAGLVSGEDGGIVRLASAGSFGGVSLLSGGSITVDGGGASATSLLTLGGAGGTIRMETRGQPISMSGSLLARGGAVTGNGTGGVGGLVLAASDFTGAGVAGDITLNSDGSIDASGGGGAVGGAARSTFPGGTAVTDPPANLAVVFDANDDLATSGAPAGAGKVLNLGSITVTGGAGVPAGPGGDVFFNGLNSLGAVLTLTDGGAQNRAGGVAPGDFFPN